MKILVVHNAYQTTGGEDVVAASEVDLLRAAGHSVDYLTVSNHGIASIGDKIRTFLDAPYSSRRRRWMADILRDLKPDILHVHNFFPLLTPSIYDSAFDARVPIVQTIHNYRPICASANLFRNGESCRECITAGRHRGLVHGCYRGSLFATLPVVAMQARMSMSRGWVKPAVLIALSSYQRDTLIAGGLPADRIVVKPNFAEPITRSLASSTSSTRFLFVGRMTREKGVVDLVQAWRELEDEELDLIGDGPELAYLSKTCPENVRFLGAKSALEVRRHMAAARAVIVPSMWDEPFGMVALEALVEGTPVIAASRGGLNDIIVDGVNGLLIDPHQKDGIAMAVRRFAKMAEAELRDGARTSARAFSAAHNLRQLEEIYLRALAERA